MRYKYLQLSKKHPSDYPTCTIHMKEKNNKETSVQLAGDTILVVPVGASFLNPRDIQQKIQAGSLVSLSGEETAKYLFEQKNWSKEQIRNFVHTADVKFVNKLSDTREPQTKMTESASLKPNEADPVEPLSESKEKPLVEPVKETKKSTKTKT